MGGNVNEKKLKTEKSAFSRPISHFHLQCISGKKTWAFMNKDTYYFPYKIFEAHECSVAV
jgi:hypothetical protein